MPPKNQHFVPRVYIKNWETTVYSLNEPRKPFQGVYKFSKHDLGTGDGITKENVLSNNHTYTISKEYFYIVSNCPEIAKDFGNQISIILSNRSVCAFFNGKQLLSSIDLGQALPSLDNWEFRTENSSFIVSGRKCSAIKNQIKDLRSYVIEERFSKTIENNWQAILNQFIFEVKKTLPSGPDLLRSISLDTTNNMLLSLFMMAFRNPSFDFGGIYPSIEKRILIPLFEALSGGDSHSEWNHAPHIVKRGYWITEIYKALFGDKNSAFEAMTLNAKRQLQFILFEVSDINDGEFITSDTPAFFHVNHVEAKNNNAIYFPLTPNYLLVLVHKNNSNINEVAYKQVLLHGVRKYNAIILNESCNTVISRKKHIANLLWE